MADRKGAYGGGGGDTDFRKTYDREEYARRAKEREAKEKEESKARYEAKMAGKKYHRRASTPEDVRMTTAREARLDVQSRIGTTQIVTGGGVGRKSGVGFVCSICDLSFFNNHEYIEHINSPGHLARSGQSAEVVKATLDDVRERLRYLSRKRKEESRVDETDLDKRLEKHKEEEEREREEKRRKRNEKRRSKKQQDDW
ncbi:hypothetical protein BU26DRAFT_605441 [Trematosphaeria pertusa]|uniref:C2H2-type domain-containing protein n=1 Tax=Trematosphaeria pertusa TaxID=390896 RepID=A0A6A6IC97_9PLEO|nr:uncharacterized protein BU26DRAFT_605441 [Trematosphaeria pertusa]KAF2247869.1 hypothetical protein BU26DRAFT_605441 [Trematosphaeria pertusa]